MKSNRAAVNTMLVSLLVALVGLVLAFSRIGLKLMGGSVHMIDFLQLFICMAVAVLFAFVYGWLRYNSATGITLLLVSLHDFLLTLGLVSIIGILVPQASILPVLIILTPVFTYSQTFALLRRLMQLRSGNSLRDMSHDEVATRALGQTARQRLIGSGLALLLIIAGAVGGNGQLMGFMLVPLVALGVSLFSVTQLTPHLWVLAVQRLGTRPGR